MPGKLFSMFDLYNGNTGCWPRNKLGLATVPTMTLFVYLYCLTCKIVEDFLLFIRLFPFLSLLFLADSVSIRDPTVCVSFHYNSHSYRLLFVHSLDTKSILSRVPNSSTGRVWEAEPDFSVQVNVNDWT